MIALHQEWLVLILAMAFVAPVTIIWLLMRPWMMQRRREIACKHDFTAYVQKQEGRAAFYTFFCPKCGARRVGGIDTQIGLIERYGPKVKLSETDE